MEPRLKSTGLAYLFCVLFGMVCLCGIHRFYLRKPLTGLLWFLTFGLLFIGQLVDLFLIPRMVEDRNAVIRARFREKRQRSRNGENLGTQEAEAGLKRCPECAELIRAGARKCRFCGEDLTGSRYRADGEITICGCPECAHVLEVPTHLLGAPGKCQHCGAVIMPSAEATASRPWRHA